MQLGYDFFMLTLKWAPTVANGLADEVSRWSRDTIVINSDRTHSGLYGRLLGPFDIDLIACMYGVSASVPTDGLPAAVPF